MDQCRACRSRSNSRSASKPAASATQMSRLSSALTIANTASRSCAGYGDCASASVASITPSKGPNSAATRSSTRTSHRHFVSDLPSGAKGVLIAMVGMCGYVRSGESTARTTTSLPPPRRRYSSHHRPPFLTLQSAADPLTSCAATRPRVGWCPTTMVAASVPSGQPAASSTSSTDAPGASRSTTLTSISSAAAVWRARTAGLASTWHFPGRRLRSHAATFAACLRPLAVSSRSRSLLPSSA